MEKKHLIGLGAVGLVVILVLLFPTVQQVLFKMDAQAAMRDTLGRYPNASQVIALEAELRKAAENRWIDPAGLTEGTP